MDSFSSLPPDEEQTFVVYEQRMLSTSNMANKIGWAISLAMFVVLIVIVYSHPAPKPEVDEPPAAAATE